MRGEKMEADAIGADRVWALHEEASVCPPCPFSSPTRTATKPCVRNSSSNWRCSSGGVRLKIGYDRKISPGSDWDAEIAAKLESARVILLLVSSEFLASDYCSNREMKRAFERHAAKEACVVPVILRPALWTRSPEATLHALPEDGRPVTTWENRDEAWLDVAAGINRLVGRFAPAVAPPSPAPPLDPTTASRITSETPETAAQGLGALANLMSETHVRRAVRIEFQTQFAASRKQFRLLADYKAIHDILHHLQLGCYNRIKKAAEGFPDNAGDTDEPVSQQMELEETLNQFKKLCESGSSVADRAGPAASWRPSPRDTRY